MTEATAEAEAAVIAAGVIGPAGPAFRPLPRPIGPGQLVRGAVAAATPVRAPARLRR